MLRSGSRRLQSLLRMCDLFAVSQFIKYKGESDFKTATGGFCSVAILTIFAVLFTSMAIKTVDRQIITWTSQTTNQMEPSAYNLTVAPSPFLFAIAMPRLNINDPNVRYFDFVLTQRKQVNGTEQQNTTIPLVSCTQQHFSITERLKQIFHDLPAQEWLCPPLGQQFLLSGKYTSKVMDFVDLSVYKCNPLLNLTRPCANSTLMAQLEARMGQFMLAQLFINPLLNPGNAKFLDYYLEDRNYIAFTSKLGVYSNAHLQEYSVITDESILPFTVPEEQSGVVIPELFQNIFFQVTNDRLATLYFYKSSTSTTYNRSYYKVDEFFSYVGGLVGVILGGMILLNSYNQDSFQLSLAKYLYKRQGRSTLSKFNLVYHVILFIHSILKIVTSKCGEWECIRKFQQVKQEIGKQLDISLILKRILFLERSVQTLFEKGQFEAMHFTQRPTLEESKVLRSYYNIMNLFSTSKDTKRDIQNRLNQTQNTVYLKGTIQPSFDEKQNEEISESSQEQEEVHEGFKSNISDSLKNFQKTVMTGNSISLRISKAIKWQQKQFQLQNIIINDPSHKDIRQSQLQDRNSEQSQKRDPNTQILKIKSTSKSQKWDQGNFEFINFIQ